MLKNKSIKDRLVRSSPMKRVPLVWKACSVRLVSTARTVSSTLRRTVSRLLTTKKDEKGQILQEGINELGAGASWLAAATSYSTNNLPMIPFYIYYSMFGFQRIGDLCWQAGDQQARGFLIGGTSGRTTLNGEGLQHEDGHSHIQSLTIPNCISYDPSYAYEVAVIMHDGLERMYGEKQGERLLLHHHAERKLPHAGNASRRRRKVSVKVSTNSKPLKVAKVKFSCWAPVLSCVTSVKQRRSWPKTTA
ncbi:pyruvate dehydrogenase E1 component [Klebsiella michiganensis]|uniref:Pyruvate dehydrogenase E1 component n=1 Tax=Klebsiella michiganensis TaxID=1134687 RepID=A0A7H4LZW8_9ENTR|nr:pyruvate dehydrogenase E1 component [Klebsiella michiganensis]